jgi:hypothetical protein
MSTSVLLQMSLGNKHRAPPTNDVTLLAN